MPTIPPQSRWHCYQCDSYFADPVKESDFDLPLCPHCMSDFVESRDLASEDGWQSEGSAEIEQMDPASPQVPGGFTSSFNPPSMIGNRPTNGHVPPPNGSGSGFLGMLGNVLGITPGSAIPDSNGSSQGPTVRTFQLGSPTGSGSVFGGTISFGSNSRINRQPGRRVPLMDSPTDEATDRFDQSPGFYPPGSTDQSHNAHNVDRSLDLEEIVGGIFGAAATRTGGVSFTLDRPVRNGRSRDETSTDQSLDDSATIEGMMHALIVRLTNPQLAELPWGNHTLGIDFDEQGRLGDYVFSQEGFDGVMERLMEAAGQQNHPPPATELVIQGLPRISLDETNYSEITKRNSTCNVCLEEFHLEETIILVPCRHIFHDSCLVPWLKNNGQCPICRFSLVAEAEADTAYQSHSDRARENASQGNGNPIATVLNDITSYLRGHVEGGSHDIRDAELSRPSEHEGNTSARNTETQDPLSLNLALDCAAETNLPDGTQEPIKENGQGGDEDMSCGEANSSTAYSSAIPQDYRDSMRKRERELQDRDGGD